jgi:1-acyl-sn-glycerol-3-phosphate acyltransferase
MTRIRIYKALSVFVFAFLYIFTALVILAGFPFLLVRAKTVVRFLMRAWAKGVFLIMGLKIEVRGRENAEKSSRFILVANHSSLFDIIAIVSLFPDVAWFGHERLMKIPVFREVLVLTDYIPMRKSTVSNTRLMVSELVEKSKSNNIAIFPEGTRTLDGKLNDFYRGFIILLRASDVDLLPVTLNGFYSLKPKNRSYIDFSSVLSATIHEPFTGKYLREKSDTEIVSLIKLKIESGLEEIPEVTSEEPKVVTLKSKS